MTKNTQEELKVVLTPQSHYEFAMNAHYISELSIENPNSPISFFNENKPEISVSINVEGRHITQSIYEVINNVSVTAEAMFTVKEGEEKKDKVFVINLKFSGLFSINGLNPENIQGDDIAERTLFVECPKMLFPYVRSLITDLSSKSGYPPVMLNPIDFDAMYKNNKVKSSADK